MADGSPALKYHGQACKSCGGTERYVSTRGCVDCQKRNNAKWTAANPEKHKARVYKHRVANLDKIRERGRNGRHRSMGYPTPTRPRPLICEMPGCGSDNRQQNGKPRVLALDHNHETGAFRGWLCDRCNRGIGYFRDTPALMRAAGTYTENDGPI